MEHEFSGDASFRAVEFAGSALESCHHLLHDLVKEHGGELRVQDRAELERDLQKRKINHLLLGSFHGNPIGRTELTKVTENNQHQSQQAATRQRSKRLVYLC